MAKCNTVVRADIYCLFRKFSTFSSSSLFPPHERASAREPRSASDGSFLGPLIPQSPLEKYAHIPFRHFVHPRSVYLRPPAMQEDQTGVRGQGLPSLGGDIRPPGVATKSHSVWRQVAWGRGPRTVHEILSEVCQGLSFAGYSYPTHASSSSLFSLAGFGCGSDRL